MRIGIDATNIREGGGVTHLVELLHAASPFRHGFSEIVVWGCRATLDCLPEKSWLVKSWNNRFESGFIVRAWWQRTKLERELRINACDVLLVPGGSFATRFKPVVTMSRNMLPFEWVEMLRYGLSLASLKFILLRITQGHSFRNAAGVIFLTNYARDTVTRVAGPFSGRTAIVPHGVSPRFFAVSRRRLDNEKLGFSQAFRLLYVSIIDTYKHQVNVAVAVASLRASGLLVTVDFVGPSVRNSERRLRRVLNDVDPGGSGIRVVGKVANSDLHNCYGDADGFVFASSCENLPNILLEAMAAGLPIACSNRGPMPEVLGDSGLYFDPLEQSSIENAIRDLVASVDRRKVLGNMARERAKRFSWRRCADETFDFLHRVYDENDMSA